MDFLRSAYSTKVHFKAGDSRESTITWYKAPDGALAFPDHHYFGSRNYADRISTTNPVGEIGNIARPWSNGATPDGVVGSNFCGAESEYLGISAFRTTDMPLNAYGEPTCCDLPAGPCVQWDTAGTHRYAHAGATNLFTLRNYLHPGDYFFGELGVFDTGLWWYDNGLPCGPGGYNGSQLMSFTGGDPTTGVPCVPTAFAAYNAASSWNIPPTAPYHPGDLAVIDAPSTPPAEPVQHGSAAGTSPRSVTWPTPTTAGNLLVVVLGYNGSAVDPTMPAGWSLAIRRSFSSGNVAICYRAGAPSQSATGNFGGGTSMTVLSAEYAFVAGTSPADQVGGNTGTSASASTGVSGTTVQPYELLVAGFCEGPPLASMSTPTNGFQLLGTTNTGGITCGQAWRTTVETGTYSCTISLIASRAWRGAIATFKGA